MREYGQEFKMERMPVHGGLRVRTRVGWLLDGDRGSKAVSGRWVVVQGVEDNHWPISWGIKKKEREMPFSQGSRGGHALCGQHSPCVCPGSREYGTGIGAVHRDMVCDPVVVCACDLSVADAWWTSGWHARALSPSTPRVHKSHKGR